MVSRSTYAQIVFFAPVVIAAVVGLLVHLLRKARAGPPPGPAPWVRHLAIPGGPLVGAALAFLHLSRAEVNPLDVAQIYWVFISVGLLAGLVTWLALWTFALFATGPHAGKPANDGLDRWD
jgi:hypothetical protein